jgi:hypothetical protein
VSEADIDPISHVILITGAFVFGVFGQAVYTTACTGSTKTMELLLEAGAKLNLPVHVMLNPLVVYAKAKMQYGAMGFDSSFSHGASVRPTWYSDGRGQYHDSIPIHELWGVWEGRACILDDVKFNIIKLSIERHAVQNVATNFIEHWFRQPVNIDSDTESKSKMMEPSRIILKLILRDFNFKTTMAQDMKPLSQRIIQMEKTDSPSESIIDPILKDMLMPYVKLTASEQ